MTGHHGVGEGRRGVVVIGQLGGASDGKEGSSLNPLQFLERLIYGRHFIIRQPITAAMPRKMFGDRRNGIIAAFMYTLDISPT
jgi:hypothetical protein